MCLKHLLLLVTILGPMFHPRGEGGLLEPLPLRLLGWRPGILAGLHAGIFQEAPTGTLHELKSLHALPVPNPEDLGLPEKA